MATHDYVIANASGAAVRSDLNNALSAIVSNNSSSSEPATTYAYQWWADTTNNVLKIRNSGNSAWITLRELDGTLLMEDGTASAPGLSFADDKNTGIFSSSNDQIGISTGGTSALTIDSSQHATFSTSVSGTMKYQTSQTVSSGSSVSFDNLPSWAKRVTVLAEGLSFASTAAPLLRLKTGGSSVTTGYRSSTTAFNTTETTSSTTKTTVGFKFEAAAADMKADFTATFTNITGNTWVLSGHLGVFYSSDANGGTALAAGKVDIGGALSGVEILPSATDTFDAGTLVVICEG